MVLSIGTDGDADYYLGHQADYYTGGSEPIGRWYMPDGQFGLKDGAQIDNEVFRTLMTGIDPTNPDPGTNVIGRPPKDPRKKRVSSYDLTFSVPKSVSVLWAISDSQMRHRVERLVDDAVRRTLQTAQAHTAFIRRGRNGTDIQPTRLFGAIFQHGDARPMDNGKGELLSDMNLHQHCVLMNLGQDDRGEWYAIHAQVIMDWKMALGATHHAELARLLEESLGCRIRTVGRNGEFEVIGVPDDVLARFSRRRTLVNETLKAYGLTSAEAPELAAAITRLSREAKPAVEDAESAQTRFDRWAREALELGFTATEVLACFNHPFSAEEEHLRDLAFDDRLKTLAKDITETEATLELSDVHRAVAAICAEHGRGADDVERIVATLIDPIPLPDDLLSWDDARFDAFVEDKIASGKLVALPSTLTDNAGRRLYTAPDLIRAERGIWQACDRHRHDTRHVIPSHAVEAFIKDLHRKAAEAPSPGEEPDLAPTEEQEHALRHATTRAGLVASLEGAAGAGKSVTLKQITALYRDILGPALGVPYRVIGCSAKWLTAKAMIKDADLADEDARAAAKWIADIGLGKETIDERTVLLVDEAGQLGDRDLYDLLKPFTDAGAKVILTGDRAQQRSVGAGPALDIVASAVGSFRLERTQRMRPQADDIIVHRDGISREEAIIRVHGLSTEQQRILVKGATHVLREEIRARFRDPHYKLSPEDVLIWGENLPPLDAVKAAASLRDNQRALASLVRGPLSEAARANALAWAADSAATISPAMVYHYLHGLPWQIAEKRASLLTIEEVDALLNGHDTAVRAAVLAWAEDDSSPVTHADELRWLEGHDRRTAEARAAEAGSTTPSPPRASAAKAAARAWARRADSARSKAEDVLHHVFGLSWPDAFKRIDGMTPNERAALLSSPFDRDYNAAEADAIAKAEDWATMPTEFVTAADVLVHVYGFTRPDAEARAAAMSPQQRRKMVDLDVHHTTVRDAGQIWARQAATDVSYAPGDPAGAMKALQAYAARGHLVWLETPEDALVAAVEAWKAYMAAIPDADDILSTPARSRKFAVVIAKSNEAVRTQNALMRNHLRERGLLGPSDTIIKTQARQRIGHRHLDVDLPIAIGEQILFTERNAALDVVNGTIGCVTHITPSARNGHAVLTVQLGSGDGTRTITFDTADYADESSGRAFIEHSYAVTAFSAQGMTTAAAFAQIDSSQKSNSVYVAMSRGKSLTKLFASVQTENNFLAAELPLRQKLHATFGERDRLRSLSRFIARGQMQSAVLDAFDPTWKAKIQTIRPEDYFRHKDIEWLALSDEDLAAVIQEMTNAHTAPLPDDSDAPVFDPDALDAPTQEWLDRYDIPPPMRSPPPPHLPLFPAKASTRADRAPLSLPTGANPDPAQAIAATLCERSRTEAPSSAASHQSTPSEALVSSPAVPLGLTLPERSNGPRAPGAPSTTLHDTPFHPSTLPLILQRPWPSPEPVSLPALPTPHASAPAPTSATPAFPSVALPNWQLVSEPLNSVRTAVSGRASISRVARHLFAARIPHLRPGGPMPRDDNPVIAPRNRRGFRTYTPVNGVGRHRYDSAQVRREMDDILSGEVDFRDLLKDNGWVPVSTNSPKVNCFWTSGPKDNLDPVNTVSIIQKSKGWLWTSKDGSRRGNILSWCSEYLGWETKGRGYIDAWLALREYLPGAEPLANQTPLTEEQRQERERIRQERTERRDAERLQAEAAHRDAVADTHTHAAEGWPKLATPRRNLRRQPAGTPRHRPQHPEHLRRYHPLRPARPVRRLQAHGRRRIHHRFRAQGRRRLQQVHHRPGRQGSRRLRRPKHRHHPHRSHRDGR
ncbi:MobF family relaxase [Azospirillum canadense]|uniref:MobF family relaxase n=1 Tax=Azospirillum canadense TaxID=403962 RepID=UPI002225D87E|nr:MobF family relaxase [Azospirillum canadense]MCW2240755.1 conjugative relaxase-like TrwC/TraI family protein [Azospirillum canadense]